MLDLMQWDIIIRIEYAATKPSLPAAIFTGSPQLHHESMPNEVSMLLPTNQGPRVLIDTVVEHNKLSNEHMLGLFLADPLLNLMREQKRLYQAGIRWIANLPSVEQQDADFSQNLTDVGLDLQRELKHLAQFQAHDFNIAVVVADGLGATKAVAIDPDIIIVLPRVADFSAGFPSLRQRGSMAMEVHTATVEKGWSGALLCLGEHSEAAHESLWPEVVDGLICRPKPARFPLS
jgi:predicted TIM-barrel enzyme